VATTRLANEYDGFLAGAPGYNLPKAAVAQIWGAQQWAQAYTAGSTVTGPTGSAIPDLSTALTAAERSLVSQRILAPMALDKPYTDIPGTIIFDAEQSRKGYWLNQFCMSLMKAANRERFKADERAYLDEWPMTEEQKQAVLARDLNRCIAAGGNIYFLAKIGATDGKSFQQMAGSMTGMTEENTAT
jgi:protocatechuate 4,5-dioxygenase alpha chain